MKTPMDDRTESPAELKRQAWDWLRLLHSGHANAEDARGFREWVRTSHVHQAMYDETRRRWEALKQPAGALLRSNPEVAAYYGGTRRVPQRGRRAFLGAAASAVAVAGVAVVYPPLGLWPHPSEWGADYRTAVGEQRSLALGGGVDVTLNTRTTVRRQAGAGMTPGLDLLAGEVAVDLTGAGQPFLVTAAAGRAVAALGRFEVRYLDDKVCVTCVAGTVRVEHAAGDRLLQAGQRTIYDSVAVSGVSGVDSDEVSAWRKGVLVFRQTRLGDALEEINRYRSGRVVLMNDVARQKSVSGHFFIASLDLALTQLQHVFGLEARAFPGGLLVLS